ncbi:hypothetical protein TNCV_4021781 [Trichonephila clavipes]|nr:hypothetical protein TNCV_4021781 [Trichonephila clavipes]
MPAMVGYLNHWATAAHSTFKETLKEETQTQHSMMLQHRLPKRLPDFLSAWFTNGLVHSHTYSDNVAPTQPSHK